MRTRHLAVFLLFAAGCASSHSASDSRTLLLEEQTRVMMITEAAEGLRDQFGATFDPAKATCERCTGCPGASAPGGILHTCVCTLSCGDCVPCPAC